MSLFARALLTRYILLILHPLEQARCPNLVQIGWSLKIIDPRKYVFHYYIFPKNPIFLKVSIIHTSLAGQNFKRIEADDTVSSFHQL